MLLMKAASHPCLHFPHLDLFLFAQSASEMVTVGIQSNCCILVSKICNHTLKEKKVPSALLASSNLRLSVMIEENSLPLGPICFCLITWFPYAFSACRPLISGNMSVFVLLVAMQQQQQGCGRKVVITYL